jgi:hypothetical protein
MQVQTQWGIQPISVGWIIALIVLVVTVVLVVTNAIDPKLALLIGGLAVARLV